MKYEKGLVSVVTPMFNVEQYLEGFIRNIEQQTYKKWELLLIDDGSTDRSVDIAEEKAQKDSRIRVFKRENRPKGADACRNIGMDNAIGEYIVILDSDDKIEPFCLEQRVGFISKHKNVDYATFLGGCATEIKEGVYEKTQKIYGKKTNRDLIDCLLAADYPFGVWNNIYRSSSMSDCRWDEKIQVYQDFDFMLTTEFLGKKHLYADDSRIDYWYITGRPNAITANFISEKKHQSTMYLFDKVFVYIEQSNKRAEYKRNFKIFCALQLSRLLCQGNIQQRYEFRNLLRKHYHDIRFDLVFVAFAKNGECNKRMVNALVMALFMPMTFFSVCTKRLNCLINRKGKE